MPLSQKTSGSPAILIELVDKPQDAKAYAKIYDELVSSIVTVLKARIPRSAWSFV